MCSGPARAALQRESRLMAPSVFSDGPLMARRARVAEAWEQPARPARRDAIRDVGAAGISPEIRLRHGHRGRRRQTGYRFRKGRAEAGAGPVRGKGMSRAATLETVFVVVPAEAVPAYEAALETVCRRSARFSRTRRAGSGAWRACGRLATRTRAGGRAGDGGVATGGVDAVLQRRDTEADGWLARVYAGFPEQLIGRRFAVRGTHVAARRGAGADHAMAGCGAGVRIGRAWLDAGMFAGARTGGVPAASARLLDMGCGRGILAMACGETAAAAGAGGGYRSVVGSGHQAKWEAEWHCAASAGLPGQWLAGGRGPARPKVRSCVREHLGPSIMHDGTAPGRAPGTWRHRYPGRLAGFAGARRAGRTPTSRLEAREDVARGQLDDFVAAEINR